MDIHKLLRTPEPASAELRRALAGLGIAAKAAALPKLQAERRQLLLDVADASTLDEVERRLTEAQREHDRAVIYDEELRKRLEAAELRERIDALAARKAAVEAESVALVTLIDERYPALLAELKDMEERQRVLIQEAGQVDAELTAIGATERVQLARGKVRGPDGYGLSHLLSGPQLSGSEVVR